MRTDIQERHKVEMLLLLYQEDPAEVIRASGRDAWGGVVATSIWEETLDTL